MPTPPTIYSRNSKFFIEVDDGTWREQPLNIVEMYLRSKGFSSIRAKDKTQSTCEKLITEAIHKNHVAYAGSLAGYSAGIYTIGGRRILVTDSPVLIKPVNGWWPMLGKVFEGIFTDGWNDDQRPYFFGWLQVALQALYTKGGFNGRHRPGQILAIVGPASSGKSLTQEMITRMMGGRCARPWAYMTNKTGHNGELFGAEHLTIEDEVIRRSKRAEFGASVNGFTVNTTQRCRSMFQEAVTLTPFWRVSMTLNPVNLPIIPMLDNDLKIKFMLMMATLREMPMETKTADQRATFEDILIKELPAFIYYILHEFKIPEELRDDRFGVKYWHHPDLLRDLAAIDAGVTLKMAQQLLDTMRTHGPSGVSVHLLQSIAPEGCTPEIFRKIMTIWRGNPDVLVTDDHVTWKGRTGGVRRVEEEDKIE